MTTTATVSDESELQAAIADVQSDNTTTNYVICGHVGGKHDIIELRTTGSDTTEIPSHMNDDEALYCFAKYECVFDLSKTTKFVYIHWIGERIPAIMKGRLGVVHGSIVSYFPESHVNIDTSSKEDLEKERILDLLNTNSGTKTKVLETNDISQRQMRGFTQTQLPRKTGTQNYSVSAVPTKGLTVEILPEVYDTVSKVRSDAEPETWVVVGYKESNPKGPMMTIGSGDGGLADLMACFDEKEPMYGLYRISYTNADEIMVIKFVYITWVGSKVKPMYKAKISTNKGTAQEIFHPCHLTVFATEPSDISERDIMEQIKQQTS